MHGQDVHNERTVAHAQRLGVRGRERRRRRRQVLFGSGHLARLDDVPRRFASGDALEEGVPTMIVDCLVYCLNNLLSVVGRRYYDY